MNKYIPGLVSIIMPSYNTGKFIRETIKSVQNQTYTNWEIIFVDDKSNDDTLEIVSKINDSRIRVFVNEKNSGAAISRNKALRESRGEWIAFLDSDDLWVRNKLEKQINFMLHNDYKFTCSYSIHIDEDSKPIGILDMSPSLIGKNSLLAYNWIGCLTVMYHYPSIGLIQIENIKKRNDYALWLKIIHKYNCYCLKEVLAMYRIRKHSISHDNKLRMLKAHYDLFRNCEKFGVFTSICLTINNILFFFLRRIFLQKTYKIQ